VPTPNAPHGLTLVIRGRSDASQTRTLAYVGTFCVLVELGIIVARLAW
jgi:hypothetical protein